MSSKFSQHSRFSCNHADPDMGLNLSFSTVIPHLLLIAVQILRNELVMLRLVHPKKTVLSRNEHTLCALAVRAVLQTIRVLTSIQMMLVCTAPFLSELGYNGHCLCSV